jgi:hypothetical protein
LIGQRAAGIEECVVGPAVVAQNLCETGIHRGSMPDIAGWRRTSHPALSTAHPL